MKSQSEIFSEIKSLKIQGATNVAKMGIKSYLMNPSKESKQKLISLRPTEPLLFNSLELLERGYKKEFILKHLEESQKEINQYLFKLIKNKSKIFTHCHSSTVTSALIYAKQKGKKFEVFNTETRPLLQGRITSKELASRKIRVTTFTDSGMHEAIDQCDFAVLGADAILKSGVINKIGSEITADILYLHKKPLYILADSWKTFPKKIKIEERDFNEVWENAPKYIKVRNPAFEKIPKKFVTKIISELGILSYNDFIKKSLAFI